MLGWKFYRLLGLLSIFCFVYVKSEEEGSLPSCNNSTCGVDLYCIDRGVIKTKTSKSSFCEVIRGTSSGTSTIYFDNDFKKIDSTDLSTKTPYLAYRCKFIYGSYKASSCVLVKGTIIDGSNSVQCSGWKNKACVVTELSSLAECSSGEGVLGKVSSSNAICFGNKGFPLPTSSSTTTYALFQTANVNNIYGVGASQLIAVALTNKYATLTKASLPGGYRLNLSVSGTLKNAIIYCKANSNINNCSIIDGKSGNYINAGPDADKNKLIKCNVNGCVSIKAIAGFYIDSVNPKNIIKCNSSMDCTSSPHGTTIQNHYLENATTKRVITCNMNGPCFYENSEIKGYFLNSDTSGGKVIKCSGSTSLCEVTLDSRNYSGVGTLKVANGIVSLCVSGYCTDTSDIVTIATTKGAPVYKKLTLEFQTVFPGATSKNITVKIGTDGTAILLEKPTDGIPACGNGTDSCTDGKNDVLYCFDSTEKKIKITNIDDTGKKTCNNLKATDINSVYSNAGSYTIYFDSEGQKVSPTKDGKNNKNIVAYLCEFTGSPDTLTSCTLVNGGFVIDSNGIVTQCSGWHREGCTMTNVNNLSSCETGNVLTINKNKKICFGKISTSLPTENAYVSIAPTSVDVNYGVIENEVTFIALNKNSVLTIASSDVTTLSTAINTKGYRINYSVSNMRENALIYCSSNSLADCVVKDASSGYYVNVGYESSKNSIIKCKRTYGCVSTSTTKTACSEAKAGGLITGNKLCTSNSDTTGEDITGTVTTDSATFKYITIGPLSTTDDFPDGTKGKKIAVKVGTDGTAVLLEETSLPTCKSVKPTEACTLDKGFAVNGEHCIKDKKIYKTTILDTKRCEQIVNLSGSKGDKVISYFNISANYKKVSINELKTNTEYLVYECSLDSNNKYENCNLLKGYTNINSSKIIKCSGWMGEKCEIIQLTDCPDNGDGILGKSDSKTSICLRNGNVRIPLDTGIVNKIAFSVNDISTAYGAIKNDIVLLALSNTQAVVDNSPLGIGMKHFLNYNGENDSNNQMIQCIYNSCSMIQNNVGYYVDSGSEITNDSIIKNERSDTKAISVTTFYNKLIECSESNKICTSISKPSPGYYIDASSARTIKQGTSSVTSYSKLIRCESILDEYYESHPRCEVIGSPKAGFYMNGIPDESNKFKDSLIECIGTSSVTCQVKTLDETSGVNSIFINNDTGKLIQCIDKDNGCKAFESTGTSSAAAFYINGGKSGIFTTSVQERTDTMNYSDLLIRCTDIKCELTKGGENKVYLNANFKGTTDGSSPAVITNNKSNDSENQLIICNSGKCEPFENTAIKSDYYVNSGVNPRATDKKISALIKCTGSPAICSSSDVKLKKGVTEVFYINANSEKDPIHFLIKCTNGGCEPFTTVNSSAKAGDVEHYVHGTSTSLLDAVIECTLKSSKNAEINKFEATCDFATPKEGYIYMNSYNQRLIQCYDIVCVAFSGVLGSLSVPAYYVNAAAPISTDYIDQLIKCTGKSCKITNGSENAVFINSNFKDESIINLNPNVNGDTEKRLIICNESNMKCETSDVDATLTENVNYFVNGNSASSYTNALIKCPIPDSTLKPCVPINGIKHNIYMNGNQINDSSNYLIICGTEGSWEGCKVASGKSSNEKEYYINAGASNKKKLVDSLIGCDDSKCSTEDISREITHDVTELFYINNNYGKDENGNYKDILNYLIKCEVETGCKPYHSTNPQIGDVEYYVNGAQLNTATAIIKVEFKDEESDVNLVQFSFVENAEPDDIFLNSYTKKLIQCTNDGSRTGCSAYAGTGTENILAYYLNAAAPENNDNTSYTEQIIKCNDTECEIVNGAENDVYLNGNLAGITNGSESNPIINSGSTDNNQLIVCGNGKCYGQKCEKSLAFYINAGKYFVGSDKYPMIKCENEGEAIICKGYKIEQDTIKDSYYINGNYDYDDNNKDTVNYLIKCSSNGKCEFFINTEVVDGDILHYIHGKPDSKDKYKNAVIECTFRSDVRKRDNESVTAQCSLIENSISENGTNVYINSINSKQIIYCLRSGCEVINDNSSDLNSSYYINIDSNDNNNLIRCTSNGCEIDTSFTREDDNKVFINSLYKIGMDTKYPLIKCSPSSDLTSSYEYNCDLAISKADIELPEFYVNGDQKGSNNIIKCIKNEYSETSQLRFSCSTSSQIPKSNDIFINANFKINQKQIIKCTSDHTCYESPAYSEEEEDSTIKYYVNAGSVNANKLKDTLIKCTSSTEPCVIKNDSKDKDAYINANNKQMILCYEDKGCIAKQSNASKDKSEFYINSNNIENVLIKCSLDSITNTKKCEPVSGEDGKVYINYYNTSQLIYCIKDIGCSVKNSKAVPFIPEYYINGGNINNLLEKRKRDESSAPIKDPSTTNNINSNLLNRNLIECKNNGSVVRCSVINGNVGDVYINSNYNLETVNGKPLGESKNPLIKCYETGCIAVEITGNNLDILPKYYVNSGIKKRYNEAIIKCSKPSSACEVIDASDSQVYINSNENQPEKPIIKCIKNSCSGVTSGATESNKEYYINAGKVGEDLLNYGMIECSITNISSTPTCKCLKSDEIKIESGKNIYLNSNYSESGDTNHLIQCSKEEGCKSFRSHSTSKISEYYINAESNDINNAIIACSNNKCEKQTPNNVPNYYVGTDNKNNNGLIECIQTTISSPNIEDSKNVTKRNLEKTEKKCTLRSKFNSNGYYLNSGNDKSTNQIIICNNNDGCNSINAGLGYYINAGNPKKPIIRCESERSECVEEVSNACPKSIDAIPGDYCYENDQLKFFSSRNSTAISALSGNDLYVFATIQSNGFPGIRTETGSLFRISRYFINRFYRSGVVMIDKNRKLIDSLDNQRDISLYDCNDSTKICSERPECIHNTYMFDSENKRAIFCNNGKMEYAQFNGYVVDGNHMSIGSTHPYIIYCEDNGENCSSIKPNISTYYENSGYDSAINSLIQCSNNNCVTITAQVGFYVGHGDSKKNGIIRCKTSTNCIYSQVNYDVKLLNAGFDKTRNGIIECTVGKGCFVARAKKGYYLTYTSTLLIQCTHPKSCTEIKPTVNYYDDADSSDSRNTIINCTRNRDIVSCNAEASNEGFYTSSASNILINCKAESKCKSIKVRNGIFRSALKDSILNNKRSYKDLENQKYNETEIMNYNIEENDLKENLEYQNFNETEIKNSNINDNDIEDEVTRVRIRDIDDAYGVIRCIAGKCEILRKNELATIPVCEFYKNRCYITIEYALNKHAVTTVSAGGVCTNDDRSVLYFATDAIVVKPNVISGKTSTYVYTTTHTNCLEVNDQYTNKLFTIGPNIYKLDQGGVLQFFNTGYYFINQETNTIVNGNKIEEYNSEKVKLYRCNGINCSIIDKPDTNAYYADVSKHTIKYDVKDNAYYFVYEKGITCIFSNNKCTPNADMKNHEFCITYKGEIVLATTNIKSRETGECYRAPNIDSYIYGLSKQHLYSMNLYAAEMVNKSGYYIVSLYSNSTVVTKDYKNKYGSLIVYGCTDIYCSVYEPDEDTYYYDAQAKLLLRYRNGIWNIPNTSGYAFISVDPKNTYIYKFTKDSEEFTIQAMANYGYYYTVDNEMYVCDPNYGECMTIDETGYYFTNSGEIYYCIYDSEGLEATECTKQICESGQYYYIDDTYYRCDRNAVLTPIISRFCSRRDNVVINFPLALTEKLPNNVYRAVKDIGKHNNSTAIIKRRKKNNLDVISGVFTNCVYDIEQKKSTFDLVCINNYVILDKESDEMKICSIEQLGYVECIEDENNPQKCSISGVFFVMKPYMLQTIFFMVVIMFLNLI